MNVDELIAAEGQALPNFKSAIEAAIDDARLVWGWADDDGGALVKVFREAMQSRGMLLPKPQSGEKKWKLDHKIRQAVMERDEYRCQICASWRDLSIDHIHPQSKGGTDAPENLRVLCRSCNSKKGDR